MNNFALAWKKHPRRMRRIVSRNARKAQAAAAKLPRTAAQLAGLAKAQKVADFLGVGSNWLMSTRA